MSTCENLSPDQKAAHEFLSELRTRITTQALPYQHGLEERALESLWELFGHARMAMKANPGCQKFSSFVTRMLNLEVRPTTAKWHRAKAEGRLASHDGADEFRGDLKELQVVLRKFCAELQVMAYGDAAVPDAETPPALSDVELKACFEPVAFKLHVQSIADKKIAGDIEKREGEAIQMRRALVEGTSKCNSDAPKNVVGLALSGGGIRSATFCLGVTQVLADKRLLTDVDVLSTVSGGGYTGAFLASTLNSTGGDQAAVACPHGPDPLAIRSLRFNAKFLASANLKESWGRVTATLAGLLLNWTAPLFLVAAVALAANRLGYDESAVSWFVNAVAAVTCMSLLLYAVAMRIGDRASSMAGWLLAALSAVTLGAGIVLLAMKGYSAVSSDQYMTMSVPVLAALSAMVPTLLRFLPLVKTAGGRALTLKVALYSAGLLIPLAGFLAIYVLYWLTTKEVLIVEPPVDGFVAVSVIAALAAIVSFLFLNINATSLHRLYRDGLARTFLKEKWTALKDMNLSGYAPYHLINATLNVPSSGNIALRDRRADFFLMSRYFCGSPAAKYVRTEKWKVDTRPLDVATAVAISGAAVSPHMGLGGMPTLTALLTFLNVRLGFWLRRPEGALAWLGTSWPGFICLFREMTGVAGHVARENELLVEWQRTGAGLPQGGVRR